jgi:hypothetical protein
MDTQIHYKLNRRIDSCKKTRDLLVLVLINLELQKNTIF